MNDGSKETILIVDDEPEQCRLLQRILGAAGYETALASDAVSATQMVREHAFDAVVTDFNMPEVDGLELVRRLQASGEEVAVVMVTGRGDAAMGVDAISSGAYGYLTKPLHSNDVVVTVFNALRRRDLERENHDHRLRLQEMVEERTRGLWQALRDLERAGTDLYDLQVEVIERLARAAEYRDDETARHIDRMSRYCQVIAACMGTDREEARLLRVASVMHDVGKIGIPDRILLKAGKLSPEEFEVMKSHTLFGHGILSGSKWPLLQAAATIALTHHERWDGTGYPNGLANDEIPLHGRIAAVADVFDALTTDRVYRKALPLPEALRMLQEGRGSHFDPQILDAFFDNIPDVLAIKEMSDTDQR